MILDEMVNCCQVRVDSSWSEFRLYLQMALIGFQDVLEFSIRNEQVVQIFASIIQVFKKPADSRAIRASSCFGKRLTFEPGRIFPKRTIGGFQRGGFQVLGALSVPGITRNLEPILPLSKPGISSFGQEILGY